MASSLFLPSLSFNNHRNCRFKNSISSLKHSHQLQIASFERGDVCKFADDVISGKIKPPSSPEGRFTQILSVGIGGYALGPQFVAEALAPDNSSLKIRFIDNTDPAGIDHQIAQLGVELAFTLVIVISKSGGTPETRNGLLEVQKAFREAGLDFAKQGVDITQENSLLDNIARIEHWIARFPMFDWVGSRTSEMSSVGLLSAALQGIDCKEITLRSLLDPQDSFSFPKLWSYRNPVFLWIRAILIRNGYLKELSCNTILP